MIKPAFSEILLISIALGFDAFSVALASGAQGFKPRRIFRLAWHFGLFQFLMPVLGWGIGDYIARWIGPYGNWLVFIILLLIGGKMLWEGFKPKPENIPDLSRGWTMISLSVVTSLDAFGIGFGFGLLDYEILNPAIVIGLTCIVMTIIGLYLGVKLYDKLGHRAIILGGVILIGIGIKSLY